MSGWYFRPILGFSALQLARGLSTKSPQNVDKTAQFPGGEKSVESCHVSGFHGFSVEKGVFSTLRLAPREGNSVKNHLNRRKPKGDGGKGTGKKNVTTICDKHHDNLRHFTSTCDIL